MATPVGHALAGWSLWLLWQRRPMRLWDAAAAAFLTVLADFDLLAIAFVGAEGHYWHHTVTHTFAWSLLAGVVLALLRRVRRRPVDLSEAGLVALLVGSHCVVDYYTIDRSFPHGLPLWWPGSVEFYIAGQPVFWNIQRGSVRDLFGAHNLRAMAWEAAVLAPVCGICYLIHRWRIAAKKEGTS